MCERERERESVCVYTVFLDFNMNFIPLAKKILFENIYVSLFKRNPDSNKDRGHRYIFGVTLFRSKLEC